MHRLHVHALRGPDGQSPGLRRVEADCTQTAQSRLPRPRRPPFYATKVGNKARKHIKTIKTTRQILGLTFVVKEQPMRVNLNQSASTRQTMISNIFPRFQ
jgi:hypothetical protein